LLLEERIDWVVCCLEEERPDLANLVRNGSISLSTARAEERARSNQEVDLRFDEEGRKRFQAFLREKTARGTVPPV
jgi:hypothetical protein